MRVMIRCVENAIRPPGISALLILCASCSAHAGEIPLTVAEPVGTARSEVASGGIPLPEGKYKDPSVFSLWDGDKEIPVQVSPIVKYPDGSLHWALVSFPVSLEAGGTKTFTLKDTPGRAAPVHPVVVVEQAGKVTISNGIVSVVVNKDRFDGLQSVCFQGKEVFNAAKAGLTLDGKSAGRKPILFDLRYRGPIRTTLYVKGNYGEQANPSFAMAITLCAGEPVIHVAHNLRNGGLSAQDTEVTSADIHLGLAGKLRADESGTAPAEGRSPAAYGWQSFVGAADVLVFMRHGGPAGGGLYRAEMTKGELAIRLVPSEKPYRLAQAAHKITEIDLSFGGWRTVEALAGPLHVLAPSGWYAEHDGMGAGRGFGSLEDETKTYKSMGWSNADDPQKMPNEHQARPGMYVQEFNAHWVSECDHLQGLVLGYVRTGQRGYLDRALAWARYWQTYLNYRSDDFIYGKQGTFKTPKWGSGASAGRVCTEGCHFYGVGIFNFALLTGKIDALEAAFDTAEFANVSWYGQYSGKKPGQDFSAWGSRGFARCYLAVARAYDVARDEQWKAALLHYIGMATRTPARDPRGFTIGWSGSTPAAAARASKDSQGIAELIEKENVKIEGKYCVHPRYGKYQPKSVGTWPEAMELMANLMAYEAGFDSDDPALKLAAEDAMDYAIAEAYFGAKYAFDPVQKAVHYYLSVDYPLPDFVPVWKGGKWNEYQAQGPDSWYTKWWPGPFAAGYKLTGDRVLFDKAMEALWWGLSRDYRNPPRVPRGEAPPYARVKGNTKGDFMSPTALAFGIGARPLADLPPPAAVTDLAARALGGGKVELSWTEPAATGKLARFQVKHAAKPIKDYHEIDYRDERDTVCYWNMAVNVLAEPAPQAAGAKHTMVLENVPAGRRCFALKSFDADHRISKLSNTATLDVN